MREQTLKVIQPRPLNDSEVTVEWFAYEAVVAERDALRTEQTRLREALESLRNEVAGSLGAWENHLAQLIGVTNVRCLQRKVEEADAALSSTPTPETHKMTTPDVKDPVSGRSFDGRYDEKLDCGCVNFYRGGTVKCPAHTTPTPETTS